MENNEFTIKKVPLSTFIKLLVSLYDKGLDYVDLIGNPSDNEDKIAIAFTEEYMTEEGKKHFKENSVPEVTVSTKNKLTDNDINQLL